MIYYTLQSGPQITNDYYICYLSEYYGYPHFNPNYIFPSTNHSTTPDAIYPFPVLKEIVNAKQKRHKAYLLQSNASKNISSSSEVSPVQKSSVLPSRAAYKKSKKQGIDEIKLDFRTQWKNQNRNIVPNLVNQMMSYILKKNKSSKLINKLFEHYPHAQQWTPNKFYLYMRKIKDSVSHYVNESIIPYFFQIHQPKCEIYQEDEQQFYMKLCRIVILSFLRSDVIIISLTSSRMSEAKRKTHLIAREALLNKFLQLARH